MTYLLINMLIRSLLVEAFVLSSASMEPALLAGDHVLVIKQPLIDTIERNDIVVFSSPELPHYVYIKRVTGLPGDEVTNSDGSQIVIPADHYYVMGDNHDNSIDSRQWGPIGKGLLIGKAVLIYYSHDPATGQTRWQRMGQWIK